MDEERNTPQVPEEEARPSFKMDLYFWMQALVVALAFLILTFTLVGRVIGVKGSSMVPTLENGDLLLLRSVAYTPKQGDVVVLRKPSFPSNQTAPIVKRVIAVGGQHIQIDYSGDYGYTTVNGSQYAVGKVLVDGVALDEPYIYEPMINRNLADMTVLDVTVPEGSIYVLGDNRNNSSDSRHVMLGTVDNRYVLGQALFVVLPFGHFGAVD